MQNFRTLLIATSEFHTPSISYCWRLVNNMQNGGYCWSDDASTLERMFIDPVIDER